MADIVLRIRLVSGDQLDVTYTGPDAMDQSEAVELALTTLGEDLGVLHCSHGERRMALYARGVAAVEVAPRGAVL